MGRRRFCQNEINKGTWSKEEDEILFNYVTLYGEGNWPEVAKSSGLKRCAKSCRYRYLNYLKPDIKRGDISEDEQNLIIKLHHELGSRWALIAKRLPGRTDIEIKNYWKIYLSKKLYHQGKLDGKKPKILKNEIEKVGRQGSKGTWSRKEDEILFDYVSLYGEGQWEKVAKRTGLKRCGSSCRHRYLHYLKPGIKRGNITKSEEDVIIKLHHLHGNRWSLIAKKLPGRTDSEIKNYWHAYLSKKLQAQPESSLPLKSFQQSLEAKNIEQINFVYTPPQVPLPTSFDAENLENSYNTNTMFSTNSSQMEYEYDFALLNDFLFNTFENDQIIGDEFNPKMPKIEDNNMISSSSSSTYSSCLSSSSSSFNDHQYCKFSEDDLDLWVPSVDDELNSMIQKIEDNNGNNSSPSSSTTTFTDNQRLVAENDLDYWISSEFPFFDW